MELEARQEGASAAPTISEEIPVDPVETMLAEVRWRPGPIFMMDVCESEGRLWLVEINGLSCSWLYACDLEAVVAAAGELATSAWQRATGATA